MTAILWPKSVDGVDVLIARTMADYGECESLIEDRTAAIIYALCETFGGAQFYFPKVDSLNRAVRLADILACREQGVSVKQIARKHHVSEVHVYKLLKTSSAPSSCNSASK